MAVISEGLKLRATHETKLNAVSSRSHTIVSVTVVQRQENGEAITGTLHMVDLAGSERLKKSDSQGVRLREVRGGRRGDGGWEACMISRMDGPCVCVMC
jgi:hypothetical protein